jgi:hypothetical protein
MTRPQASAEHGSITGRLRAHSVIERPSTQPIPNGRLISPGLTC